MKAQFSLEKGPKEWSISLMNQELYDWALLLGRWLHITAAACWVGTSIFFMWLDRTFEPNPESKRPGHVGDLWMIHGGGFYHVEKLQMGPTKVPEQLHWFKWESYWTWLSGIFLVGMIFYTGGGAFLLDTAVSNISYTQAIAISVLTLFGSWFFYDFLWESTLTKKQPLIGHILTLFCVAVVSYTLCHLLSGRAAYLHVGAMMGTWMTGNVFLRIIPRQAKMVEVTKAGGVINPDWSKNAKNRSTHNTYFSLPVIFIMLSNHFPATYGSELNWLILLLVSVAGAAIREYFVVRVKKPARAKIFALVGILLLVAVVFGTSFKRGAQTTGEAPAGSQTVRSTGIGGVVGGLSLKGTIFAEGEIPKGKKLSLPPDCVGKNSGDVFSDEVIVQNGHLQNAYVQILKGHENLPKVPVPNTQVVLDQKGCVYTPRVIAARVGQEVVFVNSDPTFHNVRSFSKLNDLFNWSMPTKDQRLVQKFTEPEMVQTKCSVHPWMSATIAVMDHPYFSVTGPDGQFEIQGLLPGEYTIQAWHEVYGVQTQSVTLKNTSNDSLEFKFRK